MTVHELPIDTEGLDVEGSKMTQEEWKHVAEQQYQDWLLRNNYTEKDFQ